MRISISCTTQECDNNTKALLCNFCFVIFQMVIYRRLKMKENFELLFLQSGCSHLQGVGCLREVPYIVIWLGNFGYFGKTGHRGGWLLMWGGLATRGSTVLQRYTLQPCCIKIYSVLSKPGKEVNSCPQLLQTKSLWKHTVFVIIVYL